MDHDGEMWPLSHFLCILQVLKYVNVLHITNILTLTWHMYNLQVVLCSLPIFSISWVALLAFQPKVKLEFMTCPFNCMPTLTYHLSFTDLKSYDWFILSFLREWTLTTYTFHLNTTVLEKDKNIIENVPFDILIYLIILHLT
jgi:hypothetical protein